MLFSNRRLAVPVRLQLLESLVLPILFYGAGSWATLSPRLFRRLDWTIVTWQRHIIGNGFWSDETLSDAALRAKWKLPCLALRLTKHRLLFAIQLHRFAPAIVWESLTAADDVCKQSWLRTLRPAIHWYCRMSQDPAAPDSPQQILQWLHDLPPHAPKRIRHAVLRQVLQEHIAHRVFHAHRDIKQMCMHAGVTFDQMLPSATLSTSTVFSCAECCKTFSTVKGLNAHHWKQHQQISTERTFVFSSTCLACNRCYWTAQRLQQHLRHSRRRADGCFWWIQQHYPKSES